MYHSFLYPFIVDGHLCCFHALAIVQSAVTTHYWLTAGPRDHRLISCLICHAWARLYVTHSVTRDCGRSLRAHPGEKMQGRCWQELCWVATYLSLAEHKLDRMLAPIIAKDRMVRKMVGFLEVGRTVTKSLGKKNSAQKIVDSCGLRWFYNTGFWGSDLFIGYLTHFTEWKPVIYSHQPADNFLPDFSSQLPF